MRTGRTVRAGVSVVVLALAATACGGEEPPYYDGADSSVVAGVADSLGADVIASDSPTDASAADVRAALETAGLTKPTDVTDGLALDTGAVAGLLGVVGDADTYVVLVFDDPASAAVFAEGDPAVFSAKARDARKRLWFAGNLVAFSSPEGTATGPRVRAALRSLAEVPS